MITGDDQLCTEFSSCMKNNFENIIKTCQDNDIRKLQDFADECVKTFDYEDLTLVFDAILSTNLKKQHLGLILLRKLMIKEDNFIVQRVFDCQNLKNKLIEIFDTRSSSFETEICWIVIYLFSNVIAEPAMYMVVRFRFGLIVEFFASHHPDIEVFVNLYFLKNFVII